MLFDLLYWNFGFLRVGTSGLTAQAYGRFRTGASQPCGVPNDCRRLLVQSTMIAMIAALAIWAIQWFFVTAVLAIVPCSAEVAAVAREYFFVRIWAAPATLMLMAMKGWFIGMQDTRSPMAIDILVNVVNMGASYYLAVHTPLGIVGVAWGTLIAQYAGLTLAAWILVLKYGIVRISVREMRDAFRGPDWRRMMALNGNLFIRSLCFMVVYVGFTSLAGKYGDTELAVSSILMKLFMFFSFFVDGFAYAGEALVGKEWGKSSMTNHQSSIGPTVRALFNWAIGVGLVFTALYAIGGKGCIELLTSDAEVIAASSKYLGWLIAMPIISTLAFMWDGVYVGATAGVQIRNSMIWAAAGFVIGYMATFTWLGPQALYIGYFAHLIARAVYLTVVWKKVYTY
ncbi:MAG: MATE family efflux transporter [Paludibacteraceae bacterium]|nr:MATE family efflux transporter [Paludibacteraceae bacterium]